MENLIEGEATIVARVGIPVVEVFLCFAEEERAEKASEHKEHAVDFSGRSRCQGCSRAEATNDETDAHDEPTENTGRQIGRIHPDLIEVEDAKTYRAESQHHG